MRFREFVKLKPKQQVDLPKRKDASNIKLRSISGDKLPVTKMTPAQTAFDDDQCVGNSSQDQAQ